MSSRRLTTALAAFALVVGLGACANPDSGNAGDSGDAASPGVTRADGSNGSDGADGAAALTPEPVEETAEALEAEPVSAVIDAAPMIETGAAGPVPKRVMFIGDSVMGEVALATGAALTASNHTVSTGHRLQVGVLGLGDDWRQRWASDLTALDPDAIVLMVGPWDLNDTTRTDGTVWRLGDPGFLDWYRAELAAWVDTLTASGAEVLLLGVPPVRDGALATQLQPLDAEFRLLAADRSTVEYLDTAALLGDPSGAYLERDPGSQVALRMTDGLHLCPEGAARIADAVVAHLGVGPIDPAAWRDGPWRLDVDRFDPANCPEPPPA